MPNKKFNRYGYGTHLTKGEHSVKGTGVSHTKIKGEHKPKWRMSDTGAVRTGITFPKSSKSTVGKTGGLISKKSHVMTSNGKAKNVLV